MMTMPMLMAMLGNADWKHANRSQRRAFAALLRGKGGWGWRQRAQRKGQRK